MKLLQQDDFEGSVPETSIKFGMKMDRQMVSLLSDLIYKDKPLAVIRELSCNASDAHVAARNPAPFKIQIPTKLDAVFAVEDYGTGIPHEKIGDIYWTYGSSSKRDTNDQIGALGIGSKSPFAYTKSSFLVRNTYKGRRVQYMAFMDKHGEPNGAVVSDEQTTEPDGVRVELAVRDEDIYAFQNKIKNFFYHWPIEKRPLFSIPMEIEQPTKLLEGTGWYVNSKSSNVSVALMGGIAYPITIDAVPAPSDELLFIYGKGFVIEFPLGDLGFAASREELSYEDETIAALEARAKLVYHEFNVQLLAALAKTEATPWETTQRFMQTWRELKDRYDMQKPGEPILNLEFKHASGTVITGREIIEQSGENEVKVTINGVTPITYTTFEPGRQRNMLPSCKVWFTKKTLKRHDDDFVGPPPQVDLNSDVVWYDPASIRSQVSLADRSDTQIANRRDPGELLGSGFIAHKTVFRLRFETPRDLSEAVDWKNNDLHGFRIVLNDVARSGKPCVKKVFESYPARGGAHRTMFVDVKKLAIPDLGELQAKALIDGTILEGAPIVRLSQMKGYTAPIASRAANYGPTGKVVTVKGPIQRGLIEVREVYYGPSTTMTHVHAGSYGVQVKQISEQYVRYIKVDPATLVGLNVVTSEGGIDANLKQLLNSEKLTTLYHSGALDNWLVPDPRETSNTPTVNRDASFQTPWMLKIIVRNQAVTTDLINKGAKLIDAKKAIFDQPIVHSPDDLRRVAIIKTQATDEFAKLMNFNRDNDLLKALKASGKQSPIYVLFEKIAKLSKELEFVRSKAVVTYEQREAFVKLSLAYNDRNMKVAPFDISFAKRYPMLEHLTTPYKGFSGKIMASIVRYIHMEDARCAEEQEILNRLQASVERAKTLFMKTPMLCLPAPTKTAPVIESNIEQEELELAV